MAAITGRFLIKMFAPSSSYHFGPVNSDHTASFKSYVTWAEIAKIINDEIRRQDATNPVNDLRDENRVR